MSVSLSIRLLTVTGSRAHFRVQHSPFGPQTIKLQGKKPQTFNTKNSVLQQGVKFLPCPCGDQHRVAMLQKQSWEAGLASIATSDPQEEVASCPFQHPSRWWTKLDLPGCGYHCLICDVSLFWSFIEVSLTGKSCTDLLWRAAFISVALEVSIHRNTERIIHSAGFSWQKQLLKYWLKYNMKTVLII